MTDVIKAMELLDLAEKWLELFGVTDPFSKFRLEGYLSLKPDYRYGALALLKVGGKEVPQRILATPKLHYPFDRNGIFHFPSVKQIDVRPGKVAYFSGCEARPGRLASHRVASPWIDGSNPRD